MNSIARPKAPARALLALGCIYFAGCAEAPSGPSREVATPVRPAQVSISQLLRRPGGTYTDDAPDGVPPVDLDRVADATPQPEPLHPSANEPYTVFGRAYEPMTVFAPYRRQGTASWYGRKFHGQRTTSGEVYDMYGMTAAHPTLPIPSFARITNLENRRSVVVRINDRGPFASGRIMDLSYAAAHRLGFASSGSAQVEVESLLPQTPTMTATAAASPAPALPSAVAAPPREPEPTAMVRLVPTPTLTVSPQTPPPAEPAAPEPEQALPVSSERSGIFLQLGAFSVRANAESFRSRLANRIEAIGAPLGVEQREKLFRVQLGPFRDRAEASDAARQVRELLELRPIVVVR